jgi:hypothetical protein
MPLAGWKWNLTWRNDFFIRIVSFSLRLHRLEYARDIGCMETLLTTSVVLESPAPHLSGAKTYNRFKELHVIAFALLSYCGHPFCLSK